MATTAEGIRTIIASKLSAIEVDGAQVFVSVRADGVKDFTGYPAANVIATGGSAVQQDTHRTERTFTYRVECWQEQSEGGRTPTEADAIMVQAADAVLEAFDQDPELGGEVEIVNPVSWTYDLTVRAGSWMFASFELQVRVMVLRYDVTS